MALISRRAIPRANPPLSVRFQRYLICKLQVEHTSSHLPTSALYKLSKQRADRLCAPRTSRRSGTAINFRGENTRDRIYDSDIINTRIMDVHSRT